MYYEDAPLNAKTSTPFQVEIKNPCAVPTNFAAVPTEPPSESDSYTGFELLFDVNDFTIVPDTCEVSYACTSVLYSGDETVDQTMTCDDFDLTGQIGG